MKPGCNCSTCKKESDALIIIACISTCIVGGLFSALLYILYG